VDIPGDRLLDVLRSDYQMLYRLAADRLQSLDAAATAVPTAPEWPGSRYVGTVRSDDPGPRQWAEVNKAEQDVIRKPGPEQVRRPFCADHPAADCVTVCEVCVEYENTLLTEQLTEERAKTAILARECDRLRQRCSEAEVTRLEEVSASWQQRAVEAERQRANWQQRCQKAERRVEALRGLLRD
jgi:hypothetical protein